MSASLGGPVAADGGLSIVDVAGLYIGVPVLITGVIYSVVFWLSKPSSRSQWPILGTPTGLRRHEPAEEADLPEAAAVARPSPAVTDSAPGETVAEAHVDDAPGDAPAGPTST